MEQLAEVFKNTYTICALGIYGMIASGVFIIVGSYIILSILEGIFGKRR